MQTNEREKLDEWRNSKTENRKRNTDRFQLNLLKMWTKQCLLLLLFFSISLLYTVLNSKDAFFLGTSTVWSTNHAKIPENWSSICMQRKQPTTYRCDLSIRPIATPWSSSIDTRKIKWKTRRVPVKCFDAVFFFCQSRQSLSGCCCFNGFV